MNENFLVEIIGEIDTELLEDNYMEEDMKHAPADFMEVTLARGRQRLHHNLLKAAGITAGSLFAAGGVILAIKFKRGSLVLPVLKK